MKPATVAKWLQENANAPPPPATPAGLPDDTVSTVYPESSVSNPCASRYTGTRHHRSVPANRSTYPPTSYLERRPSSAQAHYRDHHPQIIVTPSPSRHRHNSVSADSRYIPSQPQPFAYTYSQPQANQPYYAPASAHHTRSPSRGAGQRAQSTSQYRVVPGASPRVETSRSHDPRQYTSYGTYHSTPTITLQTRSTNTKKTPLLRRIFGGIEWRSAPTKNSSQLPRSVSRSSSKSKSKSHSRSSDRESSYRGRSRSDGVVYVRY